MESASSTMLVVVVVAWVVVAYLAQTAIEFVFV